MVEGRGKPKAFFFLRKDGFLWKNVLPSGHIEKLPCIGFIFPKIISNECTQILPFPYISFDVLIPSANKENCLTNVLLNNTLSKSDPVC